MVLVGVLVVAGLVVAGLLWLGHALAGPGEDSHTCSVQRQQISAAIQLFTYQQGRAPTSMEELALPPTEEVWHFTLGDDGAIVPVPGSICDR